MLVPIAITVCGDAAVAASLPPRAPIPDTVPLDATTLIIYPDLGDDGREMALELAAALRARHGVRADVLAADSVPAGVYAERSVVVLGNILTNPEMLWLYANGHTFVDAAYPGGDGYVIHQAYDPVGAGRNVLAIGGSSEAGLRRGLTRFNRELGRLVEPSWHASLIVESTLDVVTHPPDELDAESFERLHADALQRMEQGGMWNEIMAAIHAAQHYALTGREAYLQQYHARVLAHQDFTATGKDQFYGGLEFWLPGYIQAFACAEHSGYWTDEGRRRTVEFLLQLMEILITRYGTWVHWPDGAPRPRWNHETYPAMAYFQMSEYLRRCYPGAEQIEPWAAVAARVLGDQTHFPRGTDEAYLYLPYSPSHAVRYALATREHGIFTSGTATELARLLQMITDNTGRCLGAGAQEHKDIVYYCLLPVATALRDGRFLAVNSKTRLAAERPTELREDYGPFMGRFAEFRPPLEPIEPELETAVDVFPMDAGLYRLTNTERIGAYPPVTPVAVPLEKAFDKLVFRSGYSSDQQYLLLDGFGRGRHLRMDTNAIIRFTDNDRIFIVESDTDRHVAEKFHNTLTIIRDGRGSTHVPPYAELQAAVDLPHTGFSRTEIAPYDSVNWTRNIIWLKETMFVVLDVVEARADGEYSLRCHWNGLGKASIDGASLLLEQQGQSCAITHAGDPGWTVVPDADAAQWLWDDYPHADSVIQRARQTRAVTLDEGQRTCIGNVIHTFASDQPVDVSCVPAGDGAVLVNRDHRPVLAFADAECLPPPLDVDALMGLIDEERIALAGVRSLGVDGRVLLEASAPVDVELDLVGAAATFARGCVAQVRLEGIPEPIELTGLGVRVDWAALSRLPTTVRRSLRQLDTTPGDTSTSVAQWPTLAAATVVETDLERAPTCCLFGPPGTPLEGAVIVGDKTGGEALRLDADGSVHSLWRIESAAAPTAVVWAAGDSAENGLVVFGAVDGTVTAVTADGDVAWSHRMKAARGSERRVASMAAGDVTGDGLDEIAVGSESWSTYLLGHDGSLLWERPAYAHMITCLDMADINGDGRAEVLVGTNYYTISAFDAAGKVLLGHYAQPVFRRLLTADLDGAGRPTIIAANDAHVLALDIDVGKAEPWTYTKGGSMPRSAVERFRFSTGDDVRALAVADVNGDGQPEVLAGSESGFAYCFERNGEVLAIHAAGTGVTTLAVIGSVDGPPLVATGLQGGTVRLLAPALAPVAEAQLKDECRWMAAGRDGIVWCVTGHSIAAVGITP